MGQKQFFNCNYQVLSNYILLTATLTATVSSDVQILLNIRNVKSDNICSDSKVHHVNSSAEAEQNNVSDSEGRPLRPSRSQGLLNTPKPYRYF